MDVNGVFDSYDRDVDDMKPEFRANHGEPLTKVIRHNNEDYKVVFRRYYIIVRLNHGLSKISDCLPANITVGIRFHRAGKISSNRKGTKFFLDAKSCMLKMSNEINALKVSDDSKVKVPFEYSESVVPLSNPIFCAFYAFSPELENTMGRLKNSSMEIEYLGKKC